MKPCLQLHGVQANFKPALQSWINANSVWKLQACSGAKACSCTNIGATNVRESWSSFEHHFRKQGEAPVEELSPLVRDRFLCLRAHQGAEAQDVRLACWVGRVACCIAGSSRSSYATGMPEPNRNMACRNTLMLYVRLSQAKSFSWISSGKASWTCPRLLPSMKTR